MRDFPRLLVAQVFPHFTDALFLCGKTRVYMKDEAADQLEKLKKQVIFGLKSEAEKKFQYL